MRRRELLIKKNTERPIVVDLGLPSGYKWATGNIVPNGRGGYKVGEETDYGIYVSWGNVTPHFSSNGSTFDDGYQFTSYNYSGTSGSKLTQNIPNNSTYDAAMALLGNSYHMPSKEDCDELIDNTDNEWIINYGNTGINGMKFMKKSDHSIYIFLPAFTTCQSGELNRNNTHASVWNRTTVFSGDGNTLEAYGVYRSGKLLYGASTDSNPVKYSGLPIRPIKWY